MHVNKSQKKITERTLLIAVQLPSISNNEIQESLDELVLLVDTAGGAVVDKIIFKRKALDASYYLGTGQLESLKPKIEELEIDLVIIDTNNLRPSQNRHISEMLECKVISRTEVILDIFAKRASSAEAKIQVELAQLKFIMTTLKGQGLELSRLGGGIGTRGPGETALETDRRHIANRIVLLNNKLKEVVSHRSENRKSRDYKFSGAVVGYTNAGKSSLVNRLTKSDLFAEDKLFATLDSFTRKFYINENLTVLLTDTVGFIRNLPANLISSFKSTLEEIVFSDFIIHVVDITSNNVEDKINVVQSELESLGAIDKEQILFFNKIDICPEDKINQLKLKFPEAIFGSANKKDGFDELKNRIEDIFIRSKKSFLKDNN